VADLLTRDLAALDERSHKQLRSIAATRARVLSTSPETSKMRFFKNRPLLAALIVAALVGVASGGAYVVKHTFLTIDESKSAPEIAADVESQLAQGGVTANVSADKSADGAVELTISSTDLSLPDKLREMGAIVVTPNGTDVTTHGAHSIAIEDDAHLDEAQMKRLTAAITTQPVVEAVSGNDPDLKAIVADALATAGFTDVDILFAGGDMIIKVKSPPTP
jgi:hypothetical protein